MPLIGLLTRPTTGNTRSTLVLPLYRLPPSPIPGLHTSCLIHTGKPHKAPFTLRWPNPNHLCTHCLPRSCPWPAVFSFVRNPWARALSSWHHIHKYGLNLPCQESFAKFAELPSSYGAKCLAE